MATLVAIKEAKPFSPKEENVCLKGLEVVSKQHGTICTLVESQELSAAISASTAKDGKLSVTAKASCGTVYELFFMTRFAY